MIGLNPNNFLPNVQLTTNGVTDLGCLPSNYVHLKIDGTFDGAACEIGYISEGVFVKYNDVFAVKANIQIANLLLGFWSSIAIRVTGASATTLVNVRLYPSTEDNHGSAIFAA